MKKLLTIALLMLLSTPVSAKEYVVKMITDADAKQTHSFNPSKLTIAVGDTVKFVNAQDDIHNVMFDAVPKTLKDSMIMSPDLEQEGDSWKYTFKTAGTYGFHCHPHQALGMKGTIIVGTASKQGDTQKITHDHHH